MIELDKQVRARTAERNSASKAAKKYKQNDKKNRKNITITEIENGELAKQLQRLNTLYGELVEVSDMILADGVNAENMAEETQKELLEVQKTVESLGTRLSVASQRIEDLSKQKKLAEEKGNELSEQLSRTSVLFSERAKELQRTEELLEIAVEDAIKAEEMNESLTKVRSEYRKQGRLEAAKKRRATKRAELATARANDAEQKLSDLTKVSDQILAHGAEAERRAEDEKARADYFETRVEDAEQSVTGVFNFAEEMRKRAEKEQQEVERVQQEKELLEKKNAKFEQKVVSIQAEISDLEEKFIALLREYNASAEIIHNLGWDNYKLRKRLVEVEYIGEIDQKYIADLLENKNQLEGMLEELTEKVEMIEAQKQWNIYRMNLGRVRKNLQKLVNKTQVRALVTIDLNPDNDKLIKVCDYVLGLVDVVKRVDLTEKDIDEIRDLQDMFERLVNSAGKGLVKLPKDTIKKASMVVRDIQITVEKKTKRNYIIQPK